MTALLHCTVSHSRAAGLWLAGPGDAATLDNYAGRIPTGGRLSASVQGDIADLVSKD